MSLRPVLFLALAACGGLQTDLTPPPDGTSDPTTSSTTSTTTTTTTTTSTTTTTPPTTSSCVAGADIQTAIDNATNGDTILICGGIHAVNLFVVRNVTLDAETGQTVVLEGSGAGPVINIESGRSFTLRNIEIEDGDGGTGAAGGIEAGQASMLVVENAVIRSNVGMVGGIQGPYNGTTELVDVEIDGNLGDYAGGLSIGTGSLTRVDITNNHATLRGGGVWVYPFQGPAIDQVLVSLNSTDGEGGGVVLDWASTWVGGVIDRNSAVYGGGIALVASASTLVDGAVVQDNTATLAGGGFYNGLAIGGSIAVRNTTFDSNYAPNGGGLFVQQTTDSNSSLELTNLTVVSNMADLGGGGTLDGIDATVADGSMTSNSATITGGGLSLVNGATVSAANLDVGSGSTANLPDDVDLGGVSFDYDGAVSFDCDTTCL